MVFSTCGSVVGGSDRLLREKFAEVFDDVGVLHQLDSLTPTPPRFGGVADGPFFVSLGHLESHVLDEVEDISTFSGDCRFRTEKDGLYIKVLYKIL